MLQNYKDIESAVCVGLLKAANATQIHQIQF
jgi:hypothetical protein